MKDHYPAAVKAGLLLQKIKSAGLLFGFPEESEVIGYVNFDLDEQVSFSVKYNELYPNRTVFHIADHERGIKWYPSKATVGRLIALLQHIESLMTDNENVYNEDD